MGGSSHSHCSCPNPTSYVAHQRVHGAIQHKAHFPDPQPNSPSRASKHLKVHDLGSVCTWTARSVVPPPNLVPKVTTRGKKNREKDMQKKKAGQESKVTGMHG
jgi:hypothetical protein